MNDEELDELVAETKAALTKVVESIDKLTKIQREPHRSMLEPTWKIKEQLLDGLRELSKIRSAR